VQGGEETRVAEEARQGYWGLTARGVYFAIPRDGEGVSIEFLSFATNRATRLGAVEGEVVLALPGFAVSPDDLWILLAQVARRESDLMLRRKLPLTQTAGGEALGLLDVAPSVLGRC
jgi:hypothetical protein